MIYHLWWNQHISNFVKGHNINQACCISARSSSSLKFSQKHRLDFGIIMGTRSGLEVCIRVPNPNPTRTRSGSGRVDQKISGSGRVRVGWDRFGSGSGWVGLVRVGFGLGVGCVRVWHVKLLQFWAASTVLNKKVEPSFSISKCFFACHCFSLVY